jgi:hypothetical protein
MPRGGAPPIVYLDMDGREIPSLESEDGRIQMWVPLEHIHRPSPPPSSPPRIPLLPERRFVAPEFDGPPVVQPNETAGRLANIESNRELGDQRPEIGDVGRCVRGVSHHA